MAAARNGHSVAVVRCRRPSFGVSIAHGDPSGQMRSSTLPRATSSNAGLRTPSADTQPTGCGAAGTRQRPLQPPP
eukprot:7170111-Pyramimonas_sp.AAC.1